MEEKARQHIEEIRKNKFLIGQQLSNPLTQDLHNAVINLSAELYTKDVHFLMELIQNAEDNGYSEGVEPALEFVLTYRDICGVGASATLLVFNNEVGFSKDNIESLCSVGRSTKKCQRQKGFIGEKGIGFKSVFLVCAQPHILSNGYQIRFNEAPNQDCGMGYIVPEWVTSKSFISDIQNIYGSTKIVPATTIILPLKREKLAIVKKHLSEIHPELLLFLQKIKRLSVREKTCKSVSDSISSISISSEINLVSSQTGGADSRIVHLALQEKADRPEATCRYFIYRKVFAVNTEHRVESRKNVTELSISVAFPFGDRLSRGSSSVGVFAYLPTAMVTNFPFIIQADFILTSSREAILLNNKWNLGIFHHVPSCFLGALMTCIKSPRMAEFFTIPRVLEFLPLNESSVKQLNVVRESIKLKVRSEYIVPCKSLSSEVMVLCKPAEVVRNPTSFKKILPSIKELLVPDNGKTTPEIFFLHNSVDDGKYDRLWNFLGVPSSEFSLEKLIELIKSNNLLFRVPKHVYAEIIRYFFEYWHYKSKPLRSLINMRLLKYNTGQFGNETEMSCTLGDLVTKKTRSWCNIKVYYIKQVQHHSWVKNCNLVMGSPGAKYFLTDFIVNAIAEHEMKENIWYHLRYKDVVLETSVPSYFDELSRFVRENRDPKRAISLAHLVYHSTLKFPNAMENVSGTLSLMPVVVKSGEVRGHRKVLVPASESKWVKLFGSHNLSGGELDSGNDQSTEAGEDDDVNEDKEVRRDEDEEDVEQENKSVDGDEGGEEVEDEEEEEEEDEWFDMYEELSEVYLEAANFAGQHTPENELLKFLIQHGKAIDLSDMFPRNRPIRISSCNLESDQALLLLEWIQSLRAKEGIPHLQSTKYKIPERFMESIKSGKWMKTYSGFSSPTCCYLYDGIESSTLLDLGKEFEVLSAIDEEYYEGKIRLFKDELMFIGVQFGTDNMYELIVDQVKANASSSELSAKLGISMLQFIRYSNNNNKLDVELLDTLKEGKWLKTSQGYVGPLEAVYRASGTEEAFLQITDLFIVDNAYYGSQLKKFLHELKLLGVKATDGDVYSLIPDHFKFPQDLSQMTKEAVMLLLKCIRKLGPGASSLKEKLTTPLWIKTKLEFKCPSESILLDPSWSCISDIVPLPSIDVDYYGNRIRTYKAELETIGVAVNLDQACNTLIPKVKDLIASRDLTAEAVILLLDCLKRLKTKMPLQLPHLVSYLSEEKWLKTCHGYRSASDCILSDSKWRTVSVFIDLSFIDEGFYGSNIFSYKDELKMLGVVVDFCDGAHLIAKGLEFPDGELSIPEESIKSLLHCARSLRHSTKLSDQSLLEQLFNKLRGCKWLKTHMGYRIPEESLIFRSQWKSYLEEKDGPFIDRSFYKTFSSLDFEELRAIGVKEDTIDICTSIFHALPLHDESPAILRAYRFLHKHKWSPSFDGNNFFKLWVPDLQGVGGRWVSRSACVLHDRDNLFESFLHILDKHYDQELLSYMSMNFGIDVFPNVHKYVDLWDSWVKHNHSLSFLELHSFWQYISENWRTFTQKNLEKSITMLPATSILGTVELVVRDELFIPDDLELKKAFTEVSERPLFVWFPQNGSSSLTKLYQIYMSLGVQKISKCVKFYVNCKFEKVILKEPLIGKPLVKIVMAFLSSPAVNMLVEERQRISKYLLDIPIFATDSPMLVNCSINLPISKKTMNVQVRKLVLWEKNLKRILVHKPSLNYEEIFKDIRFGSQFAQAISEAALPNATDSGDYLCLLIKWGYTLGFKEDDVDSLLLSENLVLSPMDNAFLECLSLAISASPVASGKRKSLGSDSPQTSGKVLRLQ